MRYSTRSNPRAAKTLYAVSISAIRYSERLLLSSGVKVRGSSPIRSRRSGPAISLTVPFIVPRTVPRLPATASPLWASAVSIRRLAPLFVFLSCRSSPPLIVFPLPILSTELPLTRAMAVYPPLFSRENPGICRENRPFCNRFPSPIPLSSISKKAVRRGLPLPLFIGDACLFWRFASLSLSILSFSSCLSLRTSCSTHPISGGVPASSGQNSPFGA
mmetsp:Transcript_22970/g.36088  ORF Transcript_22970/g.36088 Transcript_22970/m.36088 type:complete len:217 (-) Transcript_22970:2167-2817(-)